MCSGSEAGSYLRLIDYCITQLKAQGPSRTCNESKEKGVEGAGMHREFAESPVGVRGVRLGHSTGHRHCVFLPLPAHPSITASERIY